MTKNLEKQCQAWIGKTQKTKDIIHANKAANLKSKLTKQVASL